jgi:Spy/CpxP family protein refolding chaperone
MFSRTKLTYAGLMLGLLTAFGAIAQAQQPATQNPTEGTERREGRSSRRGPGGGAFGPGVLRELNLTDEQKQQVRTIIQQSSESNKAVREELRQLGEKKRQGTLTSEEEARARTLHEQMRASMKETETKIAGLLTAEQKATAANLMKERKANHERFGDRRRGPRGPGDAPAQRPSNP